MTRNNLLKSCDQYVEDFEKAEKSPVKKGKGPYYTGVDLGTAYIVLVVTDQNRNIVAGAHRPASVVRDGMVVDYLGAVQLVREMKEKLEKDLETKLIFASAAIPPGTDLLDGGAIKHVIQSAGFELTAILDEPTAANTIVGISIVKNGEVIKSVDEPTGGAHFTLVVSGAYKMSYEEANKYKMDPSHHRELMGVLKPVVEKIASIIKRNIAGFDLERIYLVGGTSCLTGIEEIIEKETAIKTVKPLNPLFVTPIGIAMNCTDKVSY